MRRNTLLIDAGIAVAIAVLALIVAPGLAVVGMLALLVLVFCAVSFVIDSRRRRARRPSPPRSGRSPRGPPPRRPAQRPYGSRR